MQRILLSLLIIISLATAADVAESDEFVEIGTSVLLLNSVGAVLDAQGLAVSGPNGPEFRLPWESIRSVEAQNSDEAKFRLGVKAKRNSTVVVFECDQGVSIVLEAHDVPTMPLKGALHELLGEGPVSVA